jgi:hypothetical protein
VKSAVWPSTPLIAERGGERPFSPTWSAGES